MTESSIVDSARGAAAPRVLTVACYAMLIAACFAAGFFLAPAPEDGPVSGLPGTRGWLPRPVPIGEFSLDRVDGGTGAFTRERLLGRWTLMYFGYSHCPDVCRPALEVLARVAESLAARRGNVRVERVFVSVDPRRDSPARLRDYASTADTGIVALYGSERDIAELARQVGILYTRSPADADGRYLVDHPATILLIDPHARLRAGFSLPHDTARIVDEIVAMEPAFGNAITR